MEILYIISLILFGVVLIILVFWGMYQFFYKLVLPAHEKIEKFNDKLKDKEEVNIKIESWFLKLNSKITKDFENSKVALVIGMLLLGILSFASFTGFNVLKKLDAFNYSVWQIIGIILCLLGGSGSIYQYKNKYLKQILSFRLFVLTFSTFFITEGFETISTEKFYFKYHIITGTFASLLGYSTVILGIILMYIVLIYPKFEKKFNERIQKVT